jgi:hypothetical protein
LIDKPHFEATPESKIAPDEFAHSSTLQTSASDSNNPTNGAQVSDAGSNSVLDFESATVLRKFFELLDEWDHKEGQL